jgi:hypothetical protein
MPDPVATRSTEAPTVVMNDSVVTTSPAEKPPKTASSFKWAALIVALIAVPASLFGVYLLTNTKNQPVSQNINKPNTPVSTPTRKTNSNQNSKANIANTNTNPTNANVNVNSNSVTKTDKTEVMNERIEIAPKSHYSRPFTVDAETAKIVGQVKLLEGEKIVGYIYFQKQYDEHFPDPTYKVFSFDGAKVASVNQTLVKDNYVLVFVNDSEKPLVVEGLFSVE